MLDLNEVLVFVRVAEAGSLTAAARELGVPKSSVSRRLAALEQRLGASLIQRTTRALHLTDAGQRFLSQAAPAVAAIADAEQLVGDLQDAPRGLLRITAPVELGHAFLGELFAGFLAQHPEVQIEAELSDRLVDLVDEGFDLALRVGPLDESSLIARKLGSTCRWLVASPAYLDAHGLPGRPEDLSEHACLVFSGFRQPGHWSFARGDQQRQLQVRGPLRVNSFRLIREAALADRGIALLPAFFCHADVQEGRLVRLLEDWSRAGNNFYAVYPATRHVAPKLRAFIDHLSARMDPPPWEGSAGA